MAARYEVYLNNPFRYRVKVVNDFVRLTYTLTNSGDGGGFSLDLLPDFDKSLLLEGSFVEVYRAVDGQAARLEDVFIVQSVPQAQARRGTRFYTISGGSMTRFLCGPNSRVVASLASAAGDAWTSYADDGVKFYCARAFGSGAGNTGTSIGRDLSNIYGLSIEAYRGLAPSVTISGTTRPLNDVLKELRRKSEEAAVNPKRLYWHVRPKSVNPLTFELVTMVNVFGVDLSAGSASPVYLGMEYGTLKDVDQEYSREEEINSVYIRYAAGASATRITDTAADRSYAFPGAFREKFFDATNSGTEADAQAEARGELNAGKPRRVARVNTLDSQMVVYGRDYSVGDRVTVIALDRQYTADVTGCDVAVEPGGDNVQARVEEIAPL